VVPATTVTNRAPGPRFFLDEVGKTWKTPLAFLRSEEGPGCGGELVDDDDDAGRRGLVATVEGRKPCCCCCFSCCDSSHDVCTGSLLFLLLFQKVNERPTFLTGNNNGVEADDDICSNENQIVRSISSQGNRIQKQTTT
jgi:hypothetical protein